MMKVVSGPTQQDEDVHNRSFLCEDFDVIEKKDRLIIKTTNQDREIELPRDGHSVYVMNDSGRRVDSYYWPPRKRDVDTSKQMRSV